MTPRGDAAIGEMVVTPRPLADYQAAFGLSDADLTGGPLLDCGGGASPFAAQIRARGGSAVSVDPLCRLPREDLVARLTGDLRRTRAWVSSHPGTLDWSYLGAPEVAFRVWEVALDLFAADYRPGRPDYAAAGLPELRFPTASSTSPSAAACCSPIRRR